MDENNIDELEQENEGYRPYIPVRKRRNEYRNFKKPTTKPVHSNDVEEDQKESLLDSYKKNAEIVDEQEKEDGNCLISKEEKEIIESVSEINALLETDETKHREPMKTGWRPPKYMKYLSEKKKKKLYDKFDITVDGNNVPLLLTSFQEMRLPKALIKCLKNKNILVPTSIQMQGIPAILSGRDIIAIAHTGSGKSLVFILPFICFCMEQEYELSFNKTEGPYCLIVVPSRELARQIYENIVHFLKIIKEKNNLSLVATLCIGGEPLARNDNFKNSGCHILVATPGRLLSQLNEKRIHLDDCRHLCLDEADKMIDIKFEEELRSILNFFKNQRQTVLISATMPIKIQMFARSALIEPILISSGRAGSANMNIVQDVVLTNSEEKIILLLDILQKTAPPVVIFAHKKRDVDYIHEYLLLKNISVVAIHGDMLQKERFESIKDFKSGKKDVLVATDIASKGLDFPLIEHVINYDMPPDIENYVHRIGRTGRHDRKGIATTIITKASDGPVLLDLKHLLIEANQPVPDFLQNIADLNTDNDSTYLGCSFCGGLGHKITECSKVQKLQSKRINEATSQQFSSENTEW